MKKFDEIMDLIDQVTAKMVSMHSSPQDFGAPVPLYRAEIHTIRAIGENPGINVTKLADEMGITKGAVSQTIAKLVRKGLVRKTYAADDAKEVHLELTDLGSRRTARSRAAPCTTSSGVWVRGGSRWRSRLPS